MIRFIALLVLFFPVLPIVAVVPAQDPVRSEVLAQEPARSGTGGHEAGADSDVCRAETIAPGIYEALPPEVRQVLLSEAEKRWKTLEIDETELPPAVKAAFRERLLVEMLLTEEGVFDTVLTEETLRTCYSENRSLFRRPTQIRLNHIFFAYPSGASQEQKEEIQEKAREYERLSGDVAPQLLQLNEILSREDPEGRRWGDIGYISQGTFPPETEIHLFAISQLGQTLLLEKEDGIHLFRLMDVRPHRDFGFEDVIEAVKDAVYRSVVLEEAARLAGKPSRSRPEGGGR